MRHPLREHWRATAQSLRSLRRTPGLLVTVVISLGVGVGALAVVGAVHRALAGRQVAGVRLAGLLELMETNSGSPNTFSRESFEYWRSASRTFERLASFGIQTFRLRSGPEATVEARGSVVSRDFFEVLPVRPVVGRVLSRGDWDPGADPVVVISEDIRNRLLGGATPVVGATIRLDTYPYLVVGVVPDEFAYPSGSQVWLPIGSPGGVVPVQEASLQGVGRLRRNTSRRAAAAEFAVLGARTPDALTRDTRSASVFDFGATTASQSRSALWIMTGMTALAFLIACGNVTSLLLIRALAREHENAIRAAVGAAASHLARGVMVETGLLVLAGGAVGMLVASWLSRAASPVLQSYLRVGIHLKADLSLLAMSLSFAAGAGAVVGLFPAIRAATTDPAVLLRSGGYGSTPSRLRRRAKDWVTVAEVTGAFMLVATLILMGRSYFYVQSFDLRIDARDVLTVEATVDDSVYSDRTSRIAYWRTVLDHVRSIPGVEWSAAWSVTFLNAPRGDENPAVARGEETEPVPAAVFPIAVIHATPEVFRTLGIGIRAGAASPGLSRGAGGDAAFLNEEAAELLWPEGDPLGRSLKLEPLKGEAHWVTVIGVLENTALPTEAGLGLAVYNPAKKWPQVYVITEAPPLSRGRTTGEATLGVRTRTRTPGVWHEIERRLTALSPLLTGDRPSTLHERMSRSWKLGELSLHVRAVLVAATIAVLLALVGINGVVAEAVRSRTREVGIRLALGATPSSIVRFIAGQGVRLGAVGVAIGALVSFWAFNALRAELFGVGPGRGSLLYGVGPADVWVYLVAAGLVLTTVAVVSVLAALRAARVAPVEALRSE